MAVKRIAIIGPAGVGKSTLVYSFSKHLQKRGLSVACANLDPACKHIRFEAVFDVRKHYDSQKVMKDCDLGPNAALKRIYEQIASDGKLDRALSKKAKGADVVLLDTAGSLELFLLGLFPKNLSKIADCVFFVVDGQMAQDKKDSVLIKTIASLLRLKSKLPVLSVVNKADLLAVQEKKLKSKEDKPQKKLASLDGGFQAVDDHLTGLLDEIGQREKVVFASAKDRRGFEQLHDGFNELFCECGE